MNDYYGCGYIVEDKEEKKMQWKYEDNDDGFMGSENRIITDEKKEWTQQQDLKACVLDYEKQD